MHADDILRGSPISLLFQSLSAESGWAKNWTRFTSTARDLAVYGTSSTLEHRTVSIPERSNRVCLHPSPPKGGPGGFESCSLHRGVSNEPGARAYVARSSAWRARCLLRESRRAGRGSNSARLPPAPIGTGKVPLSSIMVFSARWPPRAAAYRPAPATVL